MKAILLKNAGNTDNFIYEDIDEPTIKSEEVLIKTEALSINPVDFKVRASEEVLTMVYGEDRPAILGWDIAGKVIKSGTNVTDFQVGDRVFGMINFVGQGKAYAEYVAAPADHLSKIPEGISFEEAAASTLAALTALQVLSGKVREGDKVLIHAGSGGVGHFAIQIAKSMNAHVITTSSSQNKDFVMSLGADEHIDYRLQAFDEILGDIDFVFDMFNGDILHKSIQVVRERGTVVSIPTPEFSEEVLEVAKEKKVDLQFHMVQSSGKDMRTIAELLKNRTVVPHISRSFAFEEIEKAHEQLESGRTVGKIIVTV